MSKSRFWGGVLLLLFAGLLMGACSFFASRQGGESTAVVMEIQSPLISPTGEAIPMEIYLSEGKAPPSTPPAPYREHAELLSAEAVQELFTRLPALPSPAVAATEFKLPPELLPPPRPGIIIPEPFPPAATAPTPTVDQSAPLKVVRYAPEGEVDRVPFISITFNQPMVPLGTLQDLAAQEVPVRIEPELKGTWHWLGSKTLIFQFDSQQIDRLPQATNYRVLVPAGVTSQLGNALSEDFVFSFSTPPPKVVQTYPGGESQPRDVLFFIAFDQRIDPAKVLEMIQVFAANQQVAVRLASEAEIQADSNVQRLVKQSIAGYWLAFKATQPLPADTQVNVTIGAGVPSAEGPLVSPQATSYSFSTYAPLRVEEVHCGWYDQCPPLSPFYIKFNNPLDPTAFGESLLSVSPAIAALNANVSGNTLILEGETRGNTTYEVTLSGALRDIYGQTLGKEHTLRFKVKRADPLLFASGDYFLTLDPAANGVLTVYAMNYSHLDLKVYAVQPSDWDAFKTFVRNRYEVHTPAKMPGKLLVEKSLKLDLPPETLSTVPIDLKPYTQNGLGQFVVMVSPAKPLILSEEARRRLESQTVIVWVQLTQIAIDAYCDSEQMIVFVSDLRNGAPLEGVGVQAENGSPFFSDATGMVRFSLPASATYLTARKGEDLAFLPRSSSLWDQDAWMPRPLSASLAWFVFDDRQIYRPGEEVHVKGWLRRIGAGVNGDVGLLDQALPPLSFQVKDALGNLIGSGEASINGWGGFDFSFPLPEQVNLGRAQLTLTARTDLNGESYQHTFQIQEFRRPEFEVTARNESQPPFFVQGEATVSVEASYYAGGGLADAAVTWHVISSPTNYHPPGWDDFTFGEWQPWWWIEQPPNGKSEEETFQGKTDAAGFHYLKLEFSAPPSSLSNPRPRQVVAQATVMDVNRQAWSSATTLLVHPAEFYVGLRTSRYFVPKGTPLAVEFIVTDLDGKAVSGQAVEIQASRLEWKMRNGRWVQEESETQTCQAISAEEPTRCTFQTPFGGPLRITARVRDRRERLNQSTLTRWVSGGETRPSLKIEQERVTLIPDQQTYQPGETAELLVQAPFAPAEGLLTVSREGILYTQRFQVDQSGSTTLHIPIEESHLPNLNVQVDLVGSTARRDPSGLPQAELPPRPAYASGNLVLNIPPLTRTLSVSVAPQQSQLEPGAETNVLVSVTDAGGQPVANAEVALVVVDEAILSLTSYQLGDPLAAFYPLRSSATESRYGRASLLLSDPLTLAQQLAQKSLVMEAIPAMDIRATLMPAMMAEEGSAAAAPQPIPLRLDFNPLALFAPSVQTDADGKVQVAFKLPDNLTRYRIMAVAVDRGGSRFGKGEAALTARLPLMVRPSAPRFLNFGDAFELPVVVQNQTDAELEVQVVARANNLRLLQNGWRIHLGANERLEVRFPAQTVSAGSAQVQVAAVSERYADAAQIEFPVYTPATDEAFATYGVIDSGSVSQPIQYPSAVIPHYGGLEISTSSTALHALSDAVLYLVSYPYECSEQLASRVLAIAALRDVLAAFKAEGLPAPTELEKRVKSDLEALQRMQNRDGGFPIWQSGQESSPFHSIHVAHALVRARQKDYPVSPEMLEAVLAYLSTIETAYPDWYGEQTRWTLSAYALYVRHLAGDDDPLKAQNLISQAGLENLSPAAIGWLWQVVENPSQREEIRRWVSNRVVETSAAANFITAFNEQSYLLLDSDRRSDAILLDALMSDNPQSDLIPKLVNGLLAQRVKGRWNNTQENVFVLLALDRYFNLYESQSADFVARLWLGETYAGSSAFRGYTSEIHELVIPMDFLLAQTASATPSLLLSKEGAGRLYYRLALHYAPQTLQFAALDRGFVVERRYEAVDDAQDVIRDAQGRWHIRAGARLRVRLTLVADNRRYHVALVDPLPAGLEILNPALAVTGNFPKATPPSQPFSSWWWQTWYDHQNLRDNRAEVFCSLLWEGVYEYSYLARATTPGTFLVPPAKAEEMYSPEVFGRSASDVVIIE